MHNNQLIKSGSDDEDSQSRLKILNYIGANERSTDTEQKVSYLLHIHVIKYR